MNTSHVNTGIVLVPDNCNLKEEWKEKHFLAANYNCKYRRRVRKNRKHSR